MKICGGNAVSYDEENLVGMFYNLCCGFNGLDAVAMDFNDAWVRSTKKLEEKEEQELSHTPPQSMHLPFPISLPSLKKIPLLPLSNELPVSSLPEAEPISPLPPITNIKPPPTIFTDLWGDSDTSSSEFDEGPFTRVLPHNQLEEEQQDLLVSEDILITPEEKISAPLPLKLDYALDGLWENEVPSEVEASEDWAEHATASFDNLNTYEELDLFDIDAVLAKQEADIQQQAYEREREVFFRESRFERWGGVSSLIYVNWDNVETAERDALERLGYANIELSKETRAFIIQAARNARLPHKQEVQLTTQLANARAQLALLPPYNEEEPIDPDVIRRRALQAEIIKIEQTLTAKMQWVAIKRAAQFLGQGIELDDLIQFGMLGVIAGIKHFDITRKARLLLAVRAWIFQALTRAIDNYGSAIRLPARISMQIDALKKQHLQWQLTYGRLPTRQELAEVMEISLKDLTTILNAEKILSVPKKALPIEYLIRAEYVNEGYSFQKSEVDLTSSDDLYADILGEINGRQIQHILFQHLTSREQRVFSLRAGLDEKGDGEAYTLEEIGQLLKITRERVRQIEDKVRRKLILQLLEISQISHIPQKDVKNFGGVSEEKSTQRQIRNNERIKKYIEEIKRKGKEQNRQEDNQRQENEALDEAKHLFFGE